MENERLSHKNGWPKHQCLSDDQTHAVRMKIVSSQLLMLHFYILLTLTLKNPVVYSVFIFTSCNFIDFC